VSDALKVDLLDDHPIWGACVFVEALVDDPEAVRGAYTDQSRSWPPLHFAISKPTPRALDPWYRLGFAQMHAYGVRATGGIHFDADSVTIRRGTLEDLETAIALDRLIHDAQAAAPSYSTFTLDEREHRQTWIETLEADDVAYFVAERNGVPVGHATLYPDPADDEALHLASTAVQPSQRGSGVGRMLTSHALVYAAEQGYPRLRTNWRVTNLTASRFWPARGFELTHIRLVRRVPDL
jgi:ribosomal protein S18 acetylase RimI-like enzyme